MSGEGPKTAYELAMERLRQKDREAGEVEHPLSPAQKAAIAEARQRHEAKLAEREILHQDALRKARTAEDVEKANAELARDRERLAAERDRRLKEIRAGE
jgi:hypothetical protein